MSDKTKVSLSQTQMKTRPKIEDVISDVLSGEKLTVALEFIAYLKECKLNLRWASANTWVVKYKGANILYIRLTGADFFTHRSEIETGSWLISPPFNLQGDYGDLLADDCFKETVWANVNYCVGCIKCKPGNTFVILGKEIAGVCHSILNFINPGRNEIECVKHLLNYGMKEIEQAAARNGTPAKPLFSTETSEFTRLDNRTGIQAVTSPQNVPGASLFNAKYAMFHSRSNCEIFITTAEPICIKMYGLVTYKEDAVPTGWALYGAASADGAWQLLDKRTKDEHFTQPICHYAEKAFVIDTPGTYQYYKLVLEANGILFLSQVHFYV